MLNKVKSSKVDNCRNWSQRIPTFRAKALRRERNVSFSDEGPSLETLIFFEISYGSYQPFNFIRYNTLVICLLHRMLQGEKNSKKNRPCKQLLRMKIESQLQGEKNSKKNRPCKQLLRMKIESQLYIQRWIVIFSQTIRQITACSV